MINQYAILLQAFDIVISNKLWEDKTPSEVLKILMYVHTKGWLYAPMADGQVKAVICAYRIPQVNDNTLTSLPVKEEGNVLYVPFALSVDKEENIYSVIRESLKIYLEKNPDVTELVVEDKNNQIKRYTLRGAHDGKEQGAELTSNADVSN